MSEADAAHPDWQQDVEPLYSAAVIAARIEALGAQITADYAGRRLCVVGVLKGSFMFFADLVRHIELPLACEFIGISSYGQGTKSSGVVKITYDLQHSIENWDVLIVEDIIDTGLSMQYLLKNLATRNPRSLKVCTLLTKPDNTQIKVPIDYTGFTIPNAFVVGYGLDLAGTYRNLPFIGVYRGQV
jgi:hypoxanthine phosphoribosyltransferase